MLNLYFSEGCRDGTGTAALTPTTPEPTTFFFLLLSSSVSTALGSSLTWPKARSHFLGEDPKKSDRVTDVLGGGRGGFLSGENESGG